MGKGASKLKKRSSLHNLNWTRFGSLPTRSKAKRDNFVEVRKHKDIEEWLRDLGLEQYNAIFRKFNGVEDLLEFSESDIKDLGVKNSSHRASIISSLTCLRGKYHGYIKRNPIRHSVAVDNANKIKQNGDYLQRDGLISSIETDSYIIADCKINETLTLQCRYCNENDNDDPRNWYLSTGTDELGQITGTEVAYDMHNDPEENRVILMGNHDLVIKNFTENDTGFYYCNMFGTKGNSDKFSYLVGVDQSQNESNYIIGNLSYWKEYHDKYLHPANEDLRKYVDESGFNITMEVSMFWNTWGNCSCGVQPAIHQKISYCLLKVRSSHKEEGMDEVDAFLKSQWLKLPKISKSKLVNRIQGFKNKEEKFRNFEFGCRSLELKKLVPKVAEILNDIPVFIRQETCEGKCSEMSFLFGRSSKFKYRKTVVLLERSHYVMVCPETTLDSTIVWKFKGKPLKQGAVNNWTTVDAFNSIFFSNISASDEGNYTCFVNNIQMLSVRMFVVAKSKIFTQTFLRYIFYLGFILSLTLSCYCAGLVIAHNKRHNFMSFEELKLDEEKGIPHHCLF